MKITREFLVYEKNYWLTRKAVKNCYLTEYWLVRLVNGKYYGEYFVVTHFIKVDKFLKRERTRHNIWLASKVFWLRNILLN